MTAQKTTQSKPFRYGRSHKIIHWGCSFDSLLEVKFALSIQNEFEFLRSRITIYYDRTTRKPVNYLRRNYGSYTPDFLIRHKQTKKAYWIEIKPRAFTDREQLELRKEVAENYINTKNYDWEYKVIYDDEIKLTLDLIQQFNECCKLINKSKRKLLFQEYNKRFDRSAPSFFTTAPGNNRVEYVMFGIDKAIIKAL